MPAPVAVVVEEIAREAVTFFVAELAHTLISNAFDGSSAELHQQLASINETLLQIRDGIKVGPGASESIGQGDLAEIYYLISCRR